jgi:hypothetical protein
MSRTRPWVNKNIGTGHSEVTISSWKYFDDFINQEMVDCNSYIWRGQRCDDWELESTLDRLVKKRKPRYPTTFIEAHLKRFQLATRGRRGINPQALNKENDWWALGQHHGLATPLLDWTTSPFIAAFFAYIKTGTNQTRYRVIYALHRSIVEDHAGRVAKEQTKKNVERFKELRASGANLNGLPLLLRREVDPAIQFVQPLSDENKRLVNQSGLFTRFTFKKSLRDWVQDHLNPNIGAHVLIKIRIPDKDRTSCLQNLNRMNINYLSLFPDLYGASMHSNLSSEIPKY